MQHDNPYVSGLNQTNDRYMSLASGKRNWQIAAGVFGLLAVGSNVGTLYLINQRAVVPVVIEVDHKQEIVDLYRAGRQELTVSRTQVVGYQLKKWIKQARGIYPNWDFQRNEYHELFQKISGSADADLRAYYKAHAPAEIAQTYTVRVEPTSVQKVGENVWQLRWVEVTCEKASGHEESRREWEGTFTVELREPTSAEEIEANPFGVYVIDYFWAPNSKPQS